MTVITTRATGSSPRTDTEVETTTDIRLIQPYNVILLDDDDHTYEYVIEMLQAVFGHSVERGYQMAKEVDENGRVICATVHKELAELRLEQIHDYGPDPRLPKCKGSMSASIEPAA